VALCVKDTALDPPEHIEPGIQTVHPPANTINAPGTAWAGHYEERAERMNGSAGAESSPGKAVVSG